MLKKVSLVALLLVLLCVSSMFSPADVPANSFARFLGTDCMLYLEFGNIFESNQRGRELAIYKMLTSPDMRKFLKSIAEGDEEQDVPVPDDEIGMEKYDAMLEECRGLFSGQMAAAAFLPDKEPRFMFSLNINEGKKAEVEAFLSTIETKGMEIFPAPPDGEKVTVARETVEVAGKQVVKLTTSKDGEVENVSFYVVLDGYAIVSSNSEIIGQVIMAIDNPPADSLNKAPTFVSAMKGLTAKEFVAYFNPKIAKNVTPDNAKSILEMLGLQGVSFGVSFEGMDIADELRVFIEGMAQIPVLGQMVGKKCNATTAKFFPKESKLYMAAALPPFTDVWPLIADMEPVAKLDGLVMQVTGKSFGETLAPAVGSEFGFYADVKALSPEFMLALELTDSAVVLDALSMFSEMEDVGLKKFDFKEHTFFMLTNMPPMYQVNITIHENFLLVGSAAAVKTAISRDAAKSLLENSGWKKAWDEANADSPAFFFFADLKQLISQVYDSGLGMLSIMTGADLDGIPSKEMLVDNMTTMSLWFSVQPERLSVKGRGFVPATFTSILPVFVVLYLGASEELMDPMPDDFEGDDEGE